VSFNFFLYEWNILEHLDCSLNLMQCHYGQKHRFLYFVLHEKHRSIQTYVCHTVLIVA